MGKSDPQPAGEGADHASQLQIYPPSDTTARQHPSFFSLFFFHISLCLHSSEVLSDWIWKFNWIVLLLFLAPHWNLEHTQRKQSGFGIRRVIKKRKILKKKERLIEKQWATRIVDNPRKVFERRINDRYLCSGSLSFTKQTDFGSRGTLTRLKLLEQAALGNIFLFFLVLHRVGKQQDPPCKFHSRD